MSAILNNLYEMVKHHQNYLKSEDSKYHMFDEGIVSYLLSRTNKEELLGLNFHYSHPNVFITTNFPGLIEILSMNRLQKEKENDENDEKEKVNNSLKITAEKSYEMWESLINKSIPEILNKNEFLVTTKRKKNYAVSLSAVIALEDLDMWYKCYQAGKLPMLTKEEKLLILETLLLNEQKKTFYRFMFNEQKVDDLPSFVLKEFIENYHQLRKDLKLTEREMISKLFACPTILMMINSRESLNISSIIPENLIVDLIKKSDIKAIMTDFPYIISTIMPSYPPEVWLTIDENHLATKGIFYGVIKASSGLSYPQLATAVRTGKHPTGKSTSVLSCSIEFEKRLKYVGSHLSQIKLSKTQDLAIWYASILYSNNISLFEEALKHVKLPGAENSDEFYRCLDHIPKRDNPERYSWQDMLRVFAKRDLESKLSQTEKPSPRFKI